ncbi:cutinase-domain-containing protein [Massariosphaeria phaeospora]|uniref:Cutinase-domain-containing protein n=1 Tax=Massariosphaeria phaeospora TaxID=100035 RepID=A0A7C8M8Y9_9PLEO|nr:cutinase-domain-containing protein [Massariosphaeria phaeospora]
MKTTIPFLLPLLQLITPTLALPRCDSGPCDDPAVLSLQTSTCHPYHIFIARGSNSPRPGHAGELMRQICTSLGGNETCGYEDIEYPAKSGANGPGEWCKSAHAGTIAAQAQLANYTERCPESQMVLLGFSQGASVTLDSLGGGGGVQVFGCEQPENEGLSRQSAAGSRIAAIAVFGTTVRTAHTPYTVKDGAPFNGTHTRLPAYQAGLKPYYSILREYCNHGDPMCASGSKPSSLDNHLNYFRNYTDEAAEWVVQTVRKGENAKTAAEEEDLTREGTDGGSGGIIGTASSGGSRVLAMAAESPWAWWGAVMLGTTLFLCVALLAKSALSRGFLLRRRWTLL